MFFQARPHVDFKPPKLHATGPEWYVFYSVRVPDTGKFRRYRVKVNRGNQRERREAARQIMAALNEKLSIGWTPFSESAAPLATVSLVDALAAFERVKTKEMREQSLATYRSYLRVFRRWMEENGASMATTCASFDTRAAASFMDHLENREDISPRSYNNYLSFMVTLFDWLAEKGYVSGNPFAKIRRKPKRLMEKKRRLLTDAELFRLFSFLQEKNPEYLVACLLFIAAS